jgi:hypothetical protein
LTLRQFLGFGPSRFEMLETAAQRERELMHELIEAERASRRELIEATGKQQEQILKAMSESANTFNSYLNLVTSAGAPRVRIMDDGMEAAQEATRRKDSGYPGMKSLRELGEELAAKQDPSKIAQDFEHFKQELGL